MLESVGKRPLIVGAEEAKWHYMIFFFIHIYGSWDCTLDGEAGLISSIGNCGGKYVKIVVVYI